MKKPRKINFSFRLDPTFEDSLKVIAEREDRTVSYIINRMVKEYLEKDANQHGRKTQTA